MLISLKPGEKGVYKESPKINMTDLIGKRMNMRTCSDKPKCFAFTTTEPAMVVFKIYGIILFRADVL